MKLTLQNLIEKKQALSKLVNVGFSAKRSFELMPMFDEINGLFQRIDNEVKKLCKKYPEALNTPDFKKEYNNLLSTEITLKEFIPISQNEIPDFLDKNGAIDQNRTLSMANFMNLKEFILKNEPNKNNPKVN